MAVGVHRPGHRLLRDGPLPVRGRAGPPRRHRREDRQPTSDEDGGPRRLVISSDFYKVYESAGEKADGLVNLYCWAHNRRHIVRAGDANPAQPKYWTDAWLGWIGDPLPMRMTELMAAWQENAAAHRAGERGRRRERLDENAHAAWDDVINHGDRRRPQQADGRPGLQGPAKKALATVDREWDGLRAHREYPMVSLDNNAAERQIRGPS